MDEKLEGTIEKIVQLTKQNAEFDAELRRRLGVSSANSVLVDNKKIDDIYEYCINQITYLQAKEFYKDFPIEEIKETLVYDYFRMETFRRKNNFFDFCLAMYQQIENITNKICDDPLLQEVANKMWQEPWLLSQYDKKDGINIDERGRKNYKKSIASFLFSDKAEEKINKAWTELYAQDKIRIVVYFIGYQGCPLSQDKDNYWEIIGLLYELYQCRNRNHRGTPQTEKASEVLSKITSLKSFYYSKFHGLLAQYVDFVKKGYPIGDTLREHAEKLSTKS